MSTETVSVKAFHVFRNIIGVNQGKFTFKFLIHINTSSGNLAKSKSYDIRSACKDFRNNNGGAPKHRRFL